MLVILSGSSGVGKNTVINKLLEDVKDLELMPTMTTREKRPGEEDGKPYIFVSKEIFLEMIDEGGLVEYEIVHGNYYGTPKKIVHEKMSSNKVLIKDIDVDGTQNLVKNLENVITIYLKPKSKEQLIERLIGRGEDQIEVRLKRFEYEEEMSKKYKYVIVNDIMEDTVNRIKEIIKEEYNT